MKRKKKIYLTNSMEQRPYWGANSGSDSHQIPRFLWNLKVQYRVHRSPHWTPFWFSRIHPVHTLTSYFFKKRFILFLPSTRKSPKWSLSHRFLDWNLDAFIIFPHHATCLTNLNLVDFVTTIIFCEECKLWSSSLWPKRSNRIET
jgi:hypothetical protein